jgi:flagellin
MPVINTNVAAIQARGNFDRVQREMDTAISRLSSGKRINRAHDDAAGAAIAGRLESQTRGLTMTLRNARDGQALVDTMEGALQEVTSILQRMRELAVQASSGTASAADRGYLDTEASALLSEIDAIAKNTTFNEVALFSAASQHSFFTDINLTGTEIVVSANVLTANALLMSAEDAAITTVANAASAISSFDEAISQIATNRAALGAISNRFDHVIDNLTNVIANTAAAQSRVQDADYATETTALTRATILQQAATSMVAQANANKNSILTLLQA